RGHHDLTGLAERNRYARCGLADLDVAITVNRIAGLAAPFEADQTEIRGAVAGPGFDGIARFQVPPFGGPVAELAADEGVTKLPVARQRMAHRFQALDQGEENRRAADIGGDAELEHDFRLQLAGAGAARDHGRADSPRAPIEQEARRHEVI